MSAMPPGSSKWSATQTASPSLTGSLSFYKGFDFAKGTGSFFGGLQAGYNYTLPSHLVLGVEGDVSFPNTIRGNQTISSASIGEANYGETVQYFGTLRGRIGYSFNNWLVYGTSGLRLDLRPIHAGAACRHAGRRHRDSGDKRIVASMANRLDRRGRRRGSACATLEHEARISIH